MPSPWLATDVALDTVERQEEAITKLRKNHLGFVIEGRTVLDIGQTRAGDIFVLCFNPNNPVHKFVTWGVNPDNFAHRWSGHYLFTIDDGINDLNERLGIDKKVVRGPIQPT